MGVPTSLGSRLLTRCAHDIYLYIYISIYTYIYGLTTTKSFVVLIIGNSKSNHLGAQGTFEYPLTNAISRFVRSSRALGHSVTARPSSTPSPSYQSIST